MKCASCNKEMKPRPHRVNGHTEFLPCEECEARIKLESEKYPKQKPKK
jgi:hypothetical protein